MMETASEDIEEYLVSQAKKSLQIGDIFMAKSWFLTASSLFSNSFRIQFERYVMAKDEGNISEACQYLISLIEEDTTDDSKKELIYSEMRNIVNAIQSNSNSDSISFYRQLFDLLPLELQHKLLLLVANNCKETMELCQLILLILRKFPQKINEHGLKLVNILTSPFPQSHNTTSYSSENFEQLLVFEVLPVILAPSSNLKISEVQLYTLLDRTIRLFSNIFLSHLPKHEALVDRSNINSTNLESKFVNIFALLAKKLGWELCIFDCDSVECYISESVEIQYQQIYNFYQSVSVLAIGDGANAPIDLSASKRSYHDDKRKQQVFFSIVLLLLMCLSKYERLTSRKLILVENKVKNINSEKSVTITKKRKFSYNSQIPDIKISNEELKESLIGAVKCLELINNDYAFQQELENKLETFGLSSCKAYDSFVVDSHLFLGNHEELITLLSTTPKDDPKTCLQLISAYMMLFDYNSAANYVVQCVSMISRLEDKAPSENSFSEAAIRATTAAFHERSIIFLNYSTDDVLCYCIEVLISCLKNKELLSLRPNDEGIGHLVVLSQYKWPQYVDLFMSCIAVIKKGTHSPSLKFTYHLFLEYVFNPDILEEFMALVNLDGYSLELKEPLPGAAISSKLPTKSMTTRGVNKNVKEDIRNSLMFQMRQSKTSVEKEVFVKFILNEMKNYYKQNQ